tara:strand:+ start:581 stop:802 length:222 start_codon:yes stop_codon:yes gene_type:complete
MARQFRNLTAQQEKELIAEMFNEKERFYYNFYLEEKSQDLIRGIMSAYLELGRSVKANRFKKTLRQLLQEEMR